MFPTLRKSRWTPAFAGLTIEGGTLTHCHTMSFPRIAVDDEQTEAVTRVAARVTGSLPDHVNVQRVRATAGRRAFGGRIVP